MKLRTWCIRIGQILTKTVLVFTGFLVFLTLFCPSTIKAENDRGGITIRHQNVPIEKVFQSIEKQSGYRFFYNETLLQGAVKVTLNLQNASLQEALEACFHNQPLSYAIVDKTIIVKKRPEQQQQSTAPNVTAASFSKPGKIIAVRGKVTSNNIPIVGASIMIKGTDNGASTDKDGMFSLPEVEDDATLVVTSVSHAAREIRVNGQAFIAIDLAQRTDDLDEAVVVAYGTTTKRMNTGSVSVVKGDDVRDLPFRSVDKALQGLVPGLLVSSGNGQPGAGLSNFVLRGVATADNGLDGSTLRNPLIVVDGIPVSQDMQQLRKGSSPDVIINNPMAQLNPSDIESISVLKDAAAIALYGSKASNGVILITTKRGKAGKTTFNLRNQTDIAQRLKGKTNLLNEDEYMELLLETYKNTYPTASTDSIMGLIKEIFPVRVDGSFYPFTNMADLVYNKNVATVSNELSISGGNNRSVYYLNLEWTKQNGTYKKTSYDRKSLRFNFDNKVTNWLKIGMNNALSYNVQNYNFIESSGLIGTDLAAPLNPVYYEDGSYVYNYNYPSTLPNPIAAMEYNISRNTSYRGLTKFYGEVNFLRYFKLVSSVGVDFQLTEAKEKRDPRLYDPKIGTSSLGVGRITEGTLRNANLITNNILSFDKLIKRNHTINVLVGQEAQVLSQKNVVAEGTGIRFYTNDQVSNTATRTSDGSTFKQTLLSYFGQANYAYKKKYYISSSVRFDASSKFGSNQRFGTYWSAGGGWVVSSEPFMQITRKFIDYLKIRSSIGVAGNSGAINAYTKYSLLTTSNYLNAATVAVYPSTQPFNPNVKWEQTFNWDLGIETRFLNERVGVALDIYRRKTSNLIYSMSIPLNSGAQTILGNIGDIQNKGMEISLNAAIIKTKNFGWSITGNWSTNKNILLKSNVKFTKIGTWLSNEEGRNFNSYYMPIWAGVDPATGLGQWYDTTGKASSTYKVAKPEFVGKPQPDGFGSVTNEFRFKNFQLSARFYYQYGFQVYASADYSNDGTLPFSNQSKAALDRWQKPGDVALNPKRTLYNNDGYQTSTRRLFDGDFIRFQNVLLSYNLSNAITKQLRLNALRVYVQVTNLAIWTKAPGSDISNANIQGFTGSPGYPDSKTYSLGLNVNF
jgi:TonB-linked SusC/RagA family outer membrane protein